MKNILDYLPVPEEKRKTFYSTNKSKGRGNVDPRVSEDAVRKSSSQPASRFCRWALNSTVAEMAFNELK